MSSPHLEVDVGPQVGTTLVCPPGKPSAFLLYIHLEFIQVETLENVVTCSNIHYRQYLNKTVVLGKRGRHRDFQSCARDFQSCACLTKQYRGQQRTLTKEDTVAVRAVIPQSYFYCFVHEFLPWNVREVKRRVPNGILRGFGHV